MPPFFASCSAVVSRMIRPANSAARRSVSSRRWFVDGDGPSKPDLPPRLLRGSHKFADCLEDDPESVVMDCVLAFQFIQATGQDGRGSNRPAKGDEGAHDGDIHLDGARALQDAGQHGDALLRERIRGGSPPPAPS